ncbi:hypothetical protein BGZ63DRAFT_395168 [Mariannaea sp. PMI_226]|nr:hypothetical protein BGZ63DRAFT_395168 [Mariannaea sp. PMI_226]
MLGFDMTLQAVIAFKAILAVFATEESDSVRGWCCLSGGRVKGMLLNLFPRVVRIRYRGVWEVISVEGAVA